jgi:hypothetical protein
VDLKDLKLFAVILAVLGGLGYLVFFSRWRPTPNYSGPPPKYESPSRSMKIEYVDKDDPRLRYQNERFRSGGR